jgi:subtilase family serine protease
MTMRLIATGFVLAMLMAATIGASPVQAASPSSAAPVCPGPASAGTARCHAQVVVDHSGRPLVTNNVVNGYRAADLTSAYNLPSSTSGSGQTIAIVDAYNDPNAESDLAVYRSTMGLPPCTSSNGCFTKVNQSGGTKYPKTDAGWSLEISLDLDMASAICPNCKILLVEGSSNSFANLGAAVDYAAGHANVVSNSYGGSEFSGETSSTYDGHFNHPGVAITVSSGDSGYGVEYPAASQYVTAVGGTTLNWNGTTRTETAWSGAGSGCSAYEPKPGWQSGITTCANRAVADVSAVADPNTGVAVYDTVRYQGQSGWFKVGGTSVSSPIIAAVYALAGNASNVVAGSYPYSQTAALIDVTSGSNGSCGGSNLCAAGSGWDGPTGNGTPNGSGGF